jgi:hypothetical protein
MADDADEDRRAATAEPRVDGLSLAGWVDPNAWRIPALRSGR